MRPLLLMAIATVFVGSALGAEKTRAKSGVRERYNVCTVTINSDDEKKVFQQKLGTKNFRFIELLPSGRNPDDILNDPITREPTSAETSDAWFEKACRSEVRCDLLVISGHFGGTFFGQSDYSLSLDTLEKMSCSNKCKGILSAPLEVFLFGCNTLAEKDPDLRSPQEYRQALLDEGIEPNIAERVVQARYGDFGESNRERMRRSFSEVPHIYGFKSVGPSGANVKGFLQKYFSTKRNYANYVDKLATERVIKGLTEVHSQTSGSVPNRELAQAMTRTAFSQCSGLRPQEPGFEIRKRICELSDEHLSLGSRIERIGWMLSASRPLAYLPAIERFLEEHPPDTLNAEDRAVFERAVANPTAKKVFLGLIQTVHQPGLQVELFTLANQMHWIDDATFRSEVSKHILPLLNTTPISRNTEDFLCSLKPSTLSRLNLRPEDLEKTFFSLRGNSHVAGCLTSVNSEFQKAVISAILQQTYVASDFANWRFSDATVAWYTNQLKSAWADWKKGNRQSPNFVDYEYLAKDLNVLDRKGATPVLLDCMNSGTSLRDTCAVLLGKLWKGTKDEQITASLLQLFHQIVGTGDSKSSTENVLNSIRQVGAWSSELEKVISNHLLLTESWSAALALAQFSPSSSFLKKYLLKQLRGNEVEKEDAIALIHKFRLSGYTQTISRLASDRDPDVASAAREALRNLKKP